MQLVAGVQNLGRTRWQCVLLVVSACRAGSCRLCNEMRRVPELMMTCCSFAFSENDDRTEPPSQGSYLGVAMWFIVDGNQVETMRLAQTAVIAIGNGARMHC